MNKAAFVISLILRHLGSYSAGVAAMALTLWMSLAIPRYLQEAIDILRDDPDPAGGAFLSRIGWILFFAVAIILTRTASRLLFFVPGRKVEFQLKNDLLKHLSTLQREYFLANPTGAIISRINNDINGIRMMMGFGLMGLFSSLGTLSLAPFYMYEISPRLTLYVALPIMTAFVVLQLAVRRLRDEQMVQMKGMQDLSDFTVESYNGVDVIRSFRALEWAQERFSRFSHGVRDSSIRMATMRAFFMPILVHIANGLKVALVLVGGMMVINGELTMGGFMAYALYLSMLVPPLMGMTFVMFVVQRGMTALNSLETVFNTTPGLPPADAAAEGELGETLTRGLSVDGLDYAYPDAQETPVLRGVGLSIAPGETVGLFGTIGSGKTTLVNLINGYLRAPEGAVRLDGVDISRLSLATLRRHVVTVTQEPFLFSDTVRENIAFSMGGSLPGKAGENPEPVEKAASAAALEPDLKRFPLGLDTLVGEKGITLSGGQKQRIALARALLRPCSLLILDDVLSAVDQETERQLIGEIYSFRMARSTLIVSHRISALERADRIIVLEGGRVIAQGSHAELIRQEGPYRQAWIFQGERDDSGLNAARNGSGTPGESP